MSRKKSAKQFSSELLEYHRKYVELQNCGNANHLMDENGNFKPTQEIPKGQMSIGCLEECCQWLYYHPDFNDNEDERLKRILTIESIIKNLIGEMGFGYTPTWSIKYNNEKSK